MISPSLGRLVRATYPVATAHTASCRPSTATLAAVSDAIVYRRQQRRYSSSNTSVPPKGPKGANSPQQTTSNASTRSSEKKATGRSSRGRKATAKANINVPHVPPTHHLQESDVGLSSFFSLHRPISVTAAIPPTATEASFNTIFESPAQNTNKFADTIYTLSNAVQTFESAAQTAEEREMREEIMNGSSSQAAEIKHLDGPPVAQINVDELIRQSRPFNPPPAPVPFDQQQKATKRKASSKKARESKPKQKSWRTTIVVTESTDSQGEKHYSASTTPIVEIRIPSNSSVESPSSEPQLDIRQPFLERMRIRQQQWKDYNIERADKQKGKMRLISVRRQRKLKMKKHKYKKLMKRTRTLRRKLDKN